MLAQWRRRSIINGLTDGRKAGSVIPQPTAAAAMPPASAAARSAEKEQIIQDLSSAVKEVGQGVLHPLQPHLEDKQIDPSHFFAHLPPGPTSCKACGIGRLAMLCTVYGRNVVSSIRGQRTALMMLLKIHKGTGLGCRMVVWRPCW